MTSGPAGMTPVSIALFDTPLGPAAIAWTERGVLRTWTCGRDRGRTRERAHAALPGALEVAETTPPPTIRAANDGIVALFVERSTIYEPASWYRRFRHGPRATGRQPERRASGFGHGAANDCTRHERPSSSAQSSHRRRVKDEAGS